MSRQYSSFQAIPEQSPPREEPAPPVQNEVKPEATASASSSFSWSKMFGWMTSSTTAAQKSSNSPPAATPTVEERTFADESVSSTVAVTVTRPSDSSSPIDFAALGRRTSVKDIAKQLRSRIKGDGTDSDMRRYWMPDANAKSCYDCGEKFTTIRRRHHCRICGQIFCSKCCSEEIPGSMISSAIKGQLRSCNYCYNYISNCMSSSASQSVQDTSVFASPAKKPTSDTNDLAVIREQLFSLPGDDSMLNSESDTTYSPYSTVTSISSLTKRRSSIFREEDLARMSCSSNSSRTKSPFVSANTVSSAFQGTAAPRKSKLTDRRKKVEPIDVRPDHVREPKWVKEIAGNFEDSVEDSSGKSMEQSESSCEVADEADNDVGAHDAERRRDTIVSSSSTYDLQLDFNQDRVSISRSKTSPDRSLTATLVEDVKAGREFFDESEFTNQSMVLMDTKIEDQAEARTAEAVFEQINGEYERLYEKQLLQLLADEQLPTVWADVIKKMTRSVADSVRPMHEKENEDIDVRSYVKIKKISGGSRSDSMLVRGVVITKSVTHRRMRQNIPRPKILLLSCPIVYQHRVESVKFSSIDDVLLQENSYLRNVVAKIYSYRPDVVVVDKTVARTAKEILLDLGITLVCNVKSTTLERLSMFTGMNH